MVLWQLCEDQHGRLLGHNAGGMASACRILEEDDRARCHPTGLAVAHRDLQSPGEQAHELTGGARVPVSEPTRRRPKEPVSGVDDLRDLERGSGRCEVRARKIDARDSEMTSTPSRSPGSSASSTSSREPSSPSPTIATFSTTSPAGFSSSTAARASRSRGNYTSWARAKAGAARGRGKAAAGALPTPGSRARVGAVLAQGAPRQEQGAAVALRGDDRRGRAREPRPPPSRSSFRLGPRLGNEVVNAKGLTKASAIAC